MAKNIYIGVDNVARKVKQPHIGVDNVARKVKNGFIGVDNVARQFFQGGTPISNFAVGTIVKLNESGVAQEYIVVNQGIPSESSIYDSSCNGTWLLRKDLLPKMAWNTNGTVTLASSSIHAWLNSTMLEKYDSNVQNLIKQVKIPYITDSVNGAYQYGANGLSCKVFMLSSYEVGNPTVYKSTEKSTTVDGVLLSYFEDGTSTSARNKRLAYLDGTLTNWHTRSAYIHSTYKYSWAVTGGNRFPGYGTYGLVNSGNSFAVRPALVVPFETLVDENMNLS